MKKILLLSTLLIFALSAGCVSHHHRHRDYNDSYRSSDNYRGSQDSSYSRSSRHRENRERSYNGNYR